MGRLTKLTRGEISEWKLGRLLAVAYELEEMHGQAFAEAFLEDIGIERITAPDDVHREESAGSVEMEQISSAGTPLRLVQWSNAICPWRGR